MKCLQNIQYLSRTQESTVTNQIAPYCSHADTDTNNQISFHIQSRSLPRNIPSKRF